MNPKDTALQGATPVAMVPKFEPLEPLTANGHRFLAVNDGLWLEVKRDWCSVVWPLALKTNAVPMPFGKLDKKINLSFGKIPTWIIEKFISQAKNAHPAETGAVGIFQIFDGSIRYQACETISAGVGFLKARWPELNEGESVVLDMHSHGPIRAYFSTQDHKDMGADTVIACVVGKTHEAKPDVVLSLFAAGMEIHLKTPEFGIVD